MIPDSWYLVQGTFLSPNGSISNITGSYFGYPGLLTFRVFVEFKKPGNHINEVQNSRNVFFLKKKTPAGLHHTEFQSGDAATNYFTRIRISRYFIYFDRPAWVHFPKIILYMGGLSGAAL